MPKILQSKDQPSPKAPQRTSPRLRSAEGRQGQQENARGDRMDRGRGGGPFRPAWALWMVRGNRVTIPGTMAQLSWKYMEIYGKSPFFMGKFTISMVIFHSKLLNYQRVDDIWWHEKSCCQMIENDCNFCLVVITDYHHMGKWFRESTIKHGDVSTINFGAILFSHKPTSSSVKSWGPDANKVMC